MQKEGSKFPLFASTSMAAADLLCYHGHEMKKSKNTKAMRERRNFALYAIRHMPNHFLLEFSHYLRLKMIVRSINGQKKKKLGRDFKSKYSAKEVLEYKEAAKKTVLWHGSGRFQYDDAGRVKDVLAGILEAESLSPVRDIHDFFVGDMDSISTTPFRMVARSYADTHLSDSIEADRYGSSFFWVTYFYGRFYAEMFARQGITFVRKYPEWRRKASKNGSITWGQKVNADAKELWDVFNLGSDISGNYPIIFGIAKYNNKLRLSKVASKTEVRLADPVKLSDLSHVEVPREKVAETKVILEKFDNHLKVFPIELGEYAASQYDFSHLLLATTG